MYKRVWTTLLLIFTVMCSVSVIGVEAEEKVTYASETFVTSSEEQFTIDIRTVGNGAVIWEECVVEEVRATAGTDVNLVIQPGGGYYVSGLKIDGNSIAPNNANIVDRKDGTYLYTFKAIYNNSVIEVFFSPIEVITIGEGDYQIVFENEADIQSGIESDNKVTYILTHGKTVRLYFDEYTVVSDKYNMGIVSEDVRSIIYGNCTVDGVEVVLHSTDTDSFNKNTVSCRLNLKFIVDSEVPLLTVEGDNSVWLSGQETNVTIIGSASDSGESGLEKIVWFTEEKDIVADAADILNEDENLALIENNNFWINVVDIPQKDITYYIYAIDRASNIRKEVVNFLMDNNAPAVSVSVEGITGDAVTKNEYVKVNVSALDTQSGVDEIVLYLGDRIVAKTTENNELEFSVRLEANANNIITASAVDEVGNTSERVTYEGGTAGLVYDNEYPIVEITADGEAIKNTESKIICCRDNTILDVLLKDVVSGVSEVSLEINGQVITEDAEENILILDYSHMDECVNEIEFSVSTSQVEQPDDNIYNIKVKVVDKAGNIQVYSQIVYIDTVAPVISNVTAYTDSHTTILGNGGNDYTCFADGMVTVQVMADDGMAGVGVDYIEYYTSTFAGVDSPANIIKADADGKIQIVINTDFKGYICARAADLLGNVSETYVTTSGCVLESSVMHEKENHIELKPAETEYKDINQNALYADDTEVTVTVTDTYSGIKTIEWRVEAPQNVENNTEGIVEVNAFGNVSDGQWTIIETDRNLATKLSGSILVSNNSNDIVVYVKITDWAGHVSEDKIVISIDKTLPVVDITFDNLDADETYTDVFDKERVATVTVTERNFDVEKIAVLLTNSDGAVPKMSEWAEIEDASNPDNNMYRTTVLFHDEGDYVFSVTVTDLAGNISEGSKTQNFTIDKTKPELEVTFDNLNNVNGNYYNAQRIATIKIKEHNFDAERVEIIGTVNATQGNVPFPVESEWMHTTGDEYVTTVTFSQDAEYAFLISCSDKAGNESDVYEQASYIIDQTAPEIIIEGVENMSANNGEVIPIVKFSDTNYDSDNVYIELTGVNSETVQIIGEYSDLAGNKTSKTIVFSVNRFGSIYQLDDSVKEIAGTYIEEPMEVKITETNADKLIMDTIKVVLTYNGTPTTLVPDRDYVIMETGGTGEWNRYEYIIDEKMFVNDGVYVVALYSEDIAGNINQNIDERKNAEIVFGVDATEPVIVPLNIAEGETYNTDNYMASISVNDNLVLSEVSIRVNEQEITYENVGDTYTFSVPESTKKQNVVISAKDAAGNIVVYEMKDILVSTNIFIRWFNNEKAVVITIAVASVCIGGAGGVIGFRRRNIVKVRKR